MKKSRHNWNRPLVGAQQPNTHKQIEVYGSSSQVAYSRRSDVLPVTFSCCVCGQQKTEYRYPGFQPKYCGEACRKLAAEVRNKKRVAKQREKRRKARAARTSSSM